MKTLVLSEEILTACPRLVVGVLSADVTNSAYDSGLWEEIGQQQRELLARHTIDDIKQMPAIAATRSVYRRLGKDPSRYRPAGEQLMRRLLSGKSLYQIDTLVDLVNLASMRYGYCIGGFDESRVDGDIVTLGVGRKDEPYEGIGRGQLNIEHLPVYRDLQGGIGTPTSDHERTKIELATNRLLVFVNGYDGDRTHVGECVEFIRQLVRRYAASDGGQTAYYSATGVE